MNTATNNPSRTPSSELIANGLNQLSSGVTEPAPASPAATLTKATTANSASVRISAPSSPTCVRADSSMP